MPTRKLLPSETRLSSRKIKPPKQRTTPTQEIASEWKKLWVLTLGRFGNPHLAEEATQSAFIALAGKAGRLRRRTIIAGWLHRAVHFAALKLLRAETRRKRWEEQAAAMDLTGQDERAFQEYTLPHVDVALSELSDS